jgi:hypothetical protein
MNKKELPADKQFTYKLSDGTSKEIIQKEINGQLLKQKILKRMLNRFMQLLVTKKYY